MKNSKILLIIGIITIALITIFGLEINFNKDVVKKLKSDITFPTTNGFAISCDKTTAEVNEEITCLLIGHFEGGSGGMNGKYVFSSNLSKQSIVDSSEFATLVDEGVYVTKSGEFSATNAEIATIKVKGTEVGTGTITYRSAHDDAEQIEVDLAGQEALYDSVSVDLTIVAASSSGGDTPAPSTPKSTICTLENLTVSVGNLRPSFSRNNYSYNATVGNDVTSITVTGEKTDSNSNVEGFGTYSLDEGENLIQIEVIAEDGFNSNTYSVVVTREAALEPDKSSDNTLKSLNIENATISPAFNSSKIEYTAIVENNVTSVNVSAIANDSKATVAISDNENLKEGNNTITVKVTAEDNSVQTYTIVVTRKSAGGDAACTLQITSAAYKVDNTNSVIDAVNRDDTADTIRNNLSVSCGSISVNGDKVIISDGTNVKTYTINRVFIPKTGNNAIKYVAIIAGIVLIIGILIFVKKKMDK